MTVPFKNFPLMLALAEQGTGQPPDPDVPSEHEALYRGAETQFGTYLRCCRTLHQQKWIILGRQNNGWGLVFAWGQALGMGYLPGQTTASLNAEHNTDYEIPSANIEGWWPRETPDPPLPPDLPVSVVLALNSPYTDPEEFMAYWLEMHRREGGLNGK